MAKSKSSPKAPPPKVGVAMLMWPQGQSLPPSWWYGRSGVIVLQLKKNKVVTIMLNVTVGQQVGCAIVYLDQSGNPMLVQPVPDAPPTWSHNPNPAGCDTLTPSADGKTAVVQALAVGQDTVGLSVTVGGSNFGASLQLSIAAAPQVLSSVGIATTVQ